MPPLGQINQIVTFLREENPTEDISKNPVVVHPHNTSRTIPERLPPAKIKELSALQPGRALAATAEEWAAIAAAIAICAYFWHPALYLLAVMVIGVAPARAADPGTRCFALSLPADALAERPVCQPVADVADLRFGRGLPQISRNAPPIHKPAGRWKPAYLAHARRHGRTGAWMGVSQDEARLGAGAVAPRLLLYGDVLDRQRPGGLVLNPLAALDAGRQARFLLGCRRGLDRV